MTRIVDSKIKTALKAAFLLSSFFLFAAVTGFGQNTVSLTAQPMTLTMPDGSSVPMWGYSCGGVVQGAAAAAATCNYLATGTSTAPLSGWSPIIITVPANAPGTATSLTINLTNNLLFQAGATTNAIPTSLMIVGQVGGGLGNVAQRTTTPAPDHSAAQSDVTWFIAHTGPQATPPSQSARVQSFGTEVVAGVVASTPCVANVPGCAALTWSNLAPGTYLLESGTHPSIQAPMGLIGMLVVTAPPAGGASVANTPGTAYPNVSYNAEVPLEFSEIDPVQNRAVDAAVRTAGFSESATYGTYSGTSVSHINVTAPGSGYTSAPSVSVSGAGGTGVVATATVDTDPTSATYGQVLAIVVTNGGSGFIGAIPNVVISGGGGTGAAATAELALGANELGHCAEGLSSPATACYPPVVNYTPFYYLINGVPFNKTNPKASLFAATDGTATGAVTGNVLVRMVNAGVRMHVPSIVGSQTNGFDGAGKATTVNGFALVAEDGNPLPGAPRVQTDVFMAAGKTYDVMINALPAACSPTPCMVPSLPVFDRELSLSGNSSERDAGMLAYIGVNGSGLPAGAAAGTAAGYAKANADIYNSVAVSSTGAATGTPIVVSDISKGVIANDVNVYGVQLLTLPTMGTLSCSSATATANVTITNSTVNGLCANGTFTYTPTAGANFGTSTSATPDMFTYCANGTVSGTTCSSGLIATVTIGPASFGGAPSAYDSSFTAKTATYLKIAPPGVLSADSDPSGLPLKVASPSTISASNGATVVVDPDGGFVATAPGAGTYTLTYQAVNAQGTLSNSATVTLTFPTPNGPPVKVVDAQAYANCHGDSTCTSTLPAISDYRWIIEEDKTFYVDPNCTTNTGTSTTAGCPSVVGSGGTIPTQGVQLHTSHMEYVAQGCTGPLSCESGQTVLNPATGAHVAAACDIGMGACDTTATQWTAVDPTQVSLDPSKRYYISILPGDAANPFSTGNVSGPGAAAGQGCNPTPTTSCPSTGHTMSGAPIPAACNPVVSPTCTGTFAAVTVPVLPTPLPTGKLSVMVFEDDFPLNGEQDAGGGVDVLSPNEPGLGGFNLVLWDTYGTFGDTTGQDTYDMFNQPLSNSLAGTIDPSTGLDACPISAQATNDPTQAGITGMIVTCPKYEADNMTLSPLAGQAVIANLMPDKFSVQAYPGADRIARGEEWIQTNTLDGQHPHDSFIRIGEPSYFQEFGPAGYHVTIGFANPQIINARAAAVCAGAYGPVGACNNTITGQVVAQRMSRTPDQRLYPSGSPDRRELTWTQCWVSLGDPDAEDFMFTKCDANGNFTFTGVPGGNWRLTLGDQWNDQIIDGLSTPANVTGGQTLNMGQIGVQQWQANVYTKTYIDDNKNGIPDPGEIGIPFLNTMIRYRDGSRANTLGTDFNGVANFNETFPLFNWYTVEADSTRYKTTGIHTVYDAGGPADNSTSCGPANGARDCGTSTSYSFMANTYEAIPLPSDLSVPGAAYCLSADCVNEAGDPTKPGTYATGATFSANNPFLSGVQKNAGAGGSSGLSTGRIDPPWVMSEGWTGLTGQGSWIEFGKAPYAACDPTLPAAQTACVTVPATSSSTGAAMQVGENGGIRGDVVYVSTRPFDDASQMMDQPWEPLVPHVTVNLYQEGFAADGVTPTLKLVDTTASSSWDDWAQGFYPGFTDSASGTPKPYLSCPGQGQATGTNADLFYFTLFDQPNYLDYYNNVLHGTAGVTPLPYNSQYKCYDSMHIWQQVQPAPYDGVYQFPSVTGIDPTTGKPTGTNCTICVANPDSTDHYRYGSPMLPPGKYVIEVVPPPGFEIEKEEDKNLLIGDNFIAPVTQQFAGLGANIFIMPDQASVASLYDPSGAGYNPNNAQNATTGLGLANELIGTPAIPGQPQMTWPCVGAERVVPDYLSLFPQAQEVAPFAGATRPLCNRKEVTLSNQLGVMSFFSIFTPTHIASKYTGVITDDFTSEFDPFAPQFGEKFSPPNLPVSTRDYLGNELSRVYSDHFGIYDGLTFSSWDVNPPNITGYSPSMMVQCMNDPGPIPDGKGGMIQDPLYNSGYADFCYEEPYMPGTTGYLDTPTVPTKAFIGAGYNNADCAYPDATPAIAEVDGDGIGPWVSAAGNTLTITALGDQAIDNFAYSGPSASVAPFNAKTVTHHYGFGTQCTALSSSCTAISSVTIGGVAATIPPGGWTDSSITVTVPNGIPNCTIQQQAQYQGSTAQCGELLITAGNGKQSIDAVTVTVGGKAPTHVDASGTIQAAIDAALPGDLIIIDPTCTGTTATQTTPGALSCETAGATFTAKSQSAHREMLIMWKPVRLQGVGAATTVINADAHPAGLLLDPWRRHVNCLFGLTMQGVPQDASHPFDPNGQYSCPETNWNQTTWSAGTNNPQVDRLPLEAVIGWDASLNGNLAEQLQEPSLMGAFEGAGVTVLAKGLDFHGQVPWNDGTETGAFPPATTMLTGVVNNPGGAAGSAGALQVGDANPLCTDGTSGANRFPSNFVCNPSSIDGLTITNSSQGGGGIFVHGWAHFLEIANNRVHGNAGTLTGGISIGQGEFATPYIQGGAANAAPGSCSTGAGFVNNQHIPMCLQVHTNVHNNMITNNASLGDELFSATLSGGGGATFCTGNDYYKFNFNWICGNMSAGEGGGMVHLGEIFNGDIEHNSFLFNQSANPTIPTNGGGVMVQGTPDTDPVCPGVADTDCPPGLSDGTGPNLLINANLIQGNSADSGSGGGIRLQQVNGTEVATFASQPQYWNSVKITNNIINNNVAGWDGAGISMQDALNVSIINNTIAHNDALASSGVLTQSIGTPQASAPAGNCTQPGPTGPDTASCPQSAGVTSTPNSALLTATFGGGNAPTSCPPGIAAPTTTSPSCAGFSNPVLANNILWQNRSFYIGITQSGTGTLNQQNMVGLFDAFTNTAAPNQGATGACSGSDTYWDIGVRGDRTINGHESTFTLNPQYSIISSGTYAGTNLSSDPTVTAQYCNGSRVPPECTSTMGCGGPHGFGTPPGIADSLTPNPVFSLVASATVDEGNNWINLSWGPLSLTNTSVTGPDGNYGAGAPLANYVPLAGSPAIDAVPVSSTQGQIAPTTDFFGNPRPNTGGTKIDVGAIEFQPTPFTATLTSIAPNTGYRGYSLPVNLTGTNLAGATAVNVPAGSGITVANFTVVSSTSITATFNIATSAPLGAVAVTVSNPAAGGDGDEVTNAVAFTVTNPPTPHLTSISPAQGVRGTAVPVTITGTSLLTTTAITVSPAANLTVSNLTVVNDTTVTATFNIAAGSALNVRNITLTTLGGISNSVKFTVLAAPTPILNSISPSSGVRGTAVPVTLSGQFLNGGTVAISPASGISIGAVNVDPSGTFITATFTIASGTTAALGGHNVTVTTGGGTSIPVVFTVQGASLTSLTPGSAMRGGNIAVTFSGSNLTGATGITGLGGGVSLVPGSLQVVNSSTVNATLNLSTSATLTTRALGLVTPITSLAGTNTEPFTVLGPTLTSISPNPATRGTANVTLTFTGTNLSGANGVTGLAGNGIIIVAGSFNVVSPTEVQVRVNISATASTTARNVRITTTSNGNTNPVSFSVQ